MTNKISNFVFLILIILLQSCSGGRIGNFLESSFKSNNDNKISQKDVNRNLKGNIVKDNKFLTNQDKTTKIKTNYGSKSLNTVNSFSINTNNENRIKRENQNFNPKSYRVFVILKKVDPSFPTENFSKVLRNGNINFEIEKIELIPELNQNKKSM